MLDRLVNGLLRLAPWYREAEIEQREERTEQVRKRSVNERVRAEAVIAERRLSRR